MKRGNRAEQEPSRSFHPSLLNHKQTKTLLSKVSCLAVSQCISSRFLPTTWQWHPLQRHHAQRHRKIINKSFYHTRPTCLICSPSELLQISLRSGPGQLLETLVRQTSLLWIQNLNDPANNWERQMQCMGRCPLAPRPACCTILLHDTWKESPSNLILRQHLRTSNFAKSPLPLALRSSSWKSK